MHAPSVAVQSERLAIDGGEAARTRPDPPMYPGGNLIGAEEEAAVLEVLRSKRLFRYYGPQPGPSKVAEFEQAFAAHMGAPHAVAVSSGTGALMCAGAGIGLGPGDEVIVPAYTFIAPVASVAHLGAVPDPGRGGRNPQPRSRRRRAQDHSPHQGDHGGAHARRRGADGGAAGPGAGARATPDRGRGAVGWRTYRAAGSAAWAMPAASASSSTRSSPAARAAWSITADETIHQRALMLQDTVGGPRNNIPQEESLLGMNFRMTELSGAVALVQLGRLDGLLETMRDPQARPQGGHGRCPGAGRRAVPHPRRSGRGHRHRAHLLHADRRFGPTRDPGSKGRADRRQRPLRSRQGRLPRLRALGADPRAADAGRRRADPGAGASR